MYDDDFFEPDLTNPEDLATLRAMLESELEGVGSAMTGLDTEAGSLHATAGDRTLVPSNEGDTVSVERQVVSSQQQSWRAHDQEVRAALARMDVGVYGVCVRCHKSITPARLGVMPWTPCCVGCKE